MRLKLASAACCAVISLSGCSCTPHLGDQTFFVAAKWDSVVCLTTTADGRTRCSQVNPSTDAPPSSEVLFLGQAAAWYEVGTCVRAGGHPLTLTVHEVVSCPDDAQLSPPDTEDPPAIAVSLPASSSATDFARLSAQVAALTPDDGRPWLIAQNDVPQRTISLRLSPAADESEIIDLLRRKIKVNGVKVTT